MDPQAPQPGRRRPMFWVFACLAALTLVLGCVATWWHSRAVTVESAQRALDAEPETVDGLAAKLGTFTDSGYYLSATHEKPDMVNAMCDHPMLADHVHWYPGRGGRAAAAQVTFLDALVNPWRHGQQFEAEDMGVEMRTFCIYMDRTGLILGWADISGGPSVTDAVRWQRALAADKHPAPKHGE